MIKTLQIAADETFDADWRQDALHQSFGLPAFAVHTIVLGTAPNPLPAPAAIVTGTVGNDFIHVLGDGEVAPAGYIDNPTASFSADSIDVSQGGTDQVFAGAGNDDIMLGASLTAADHIDGGADFDTVYLNGDYSGANALTFSATTMVNVEDIRLGAGHSYTLTTDDATVNPGPQGMVVTAEALSGPGSVLLFNGSAEASAPFLVIGGEGNDQILGGGGNDQLIGGIGNDLLSGGGGDDILFGGYGDDTLNGGPGSDTASYLDMLDSVTINLSDPNPHVVGGLGGTDTLISIENLTGSQASDSLTGDSGDNILNGGYGGDDVLNGAGGIDTASYESDNAATVDLALSGPQDTGNGMDTLISIENLIGSGSGDTLKGDGGSNTIYGAQGDDTIDGRDGSDTLDGGSGSNTIFGGDGSDTINIASGFNDTVHAGADNDTITAGAGLRAGNQIDGGNDFDSVVLDGDYSGGHAVTFNATTMINVERVILTAGHSYSLTLHDATVAAGQSIQLDGSGLGAADAMTANAAAEMDGTVTLTGGAGNDTLTGGNGSDHLVGGAGNDVLHGGGGDDFIYGGIGNDTIDGGTGWDLLISDNDTAGFTANMVTGTASGAGIGTDTFTGIEQIVGGSGNDVMTGDANANLLYANGGTNTLNGGGGDDGLQDSGTGGSFDGGTGIDFLALDRSAMTTDVSLVFTVGSSTPVTLADGTTFKNIESLLLGTGSGNDSLTLENPQHPAPINAAGGVNSWDGGAGNDTLTVDMSGYDSPVVAAITGDHYTVMGGADPVMWAYHVENIRIFGSEHDDTFASSPGNDLFYGGGGVDTVQFTGASTDYHVTYDASAGTYTIADQRAGAPDGTDTVKDIERYHFTDTDLTSANIGTTTQTVHHSDGSTTVTVTDAANSRPWATEATTYDANGSIAEQVTATDAGSEWFNVYDTTGTNAFLWQTYYATPSGGHTSNVSVVTTNDDGSHFLEFDDPAQQYSAWSTLYFGFDANWNQNYFNGYDDNLRPNHVAVNDTIAARDTILWFAAPYDPNNGGPAVDTTLTGGGGVDVLYGFAGNDTLNGGGGNDYLNGGHGNDTLTGGAGDDRFVFRTGDGLDTISDFTPGNSSGDLIDLHGYGVTTFTALQAFMTQSGADTVIAFDDFNHIVLHNVTMAQLNAADFVLS